MSQVNVSVGSGTLIGGLAFWGYLLVKAYGVAFAAWSWWWLLLPVVPWLGLGLSRLGLI